MYIVSLLPLMLSLVLSGQEQEGVILLHGLCRTDSSMSKMERELKNSGFIVKNVAYPSRKESIEKLSNDAVGTALKSADLKDCSRIHFVTHSMGGILLRSYFNRHTCERMGRVVMLGPPNQGSEVVDTLKSWYLFRKLNGPAGSEMGTKKNSTPNSLGPVEFECGIIAGDRSVNWINSLTMIDGKDDGKVSVERTKVAGMKEHLILHVTHTFMMKNKKVIANTIRFLKTGTFSDTND
ncbi:MAG: alpha/beta hydrolase [Candidatus Hydrogenedentes bacterium]|nr:alpha/beta hydrolase [Candidatus Hydrogenedentota bacterium]